jgi:DNA gyrase subunit B
LQLQTSKMARPQSAGKLADCLQHMPAVPAELFIVEGDSAAQAVCAVRDVGFQAVLPLQGKPMNAMRASPRRLVDSPWFATLAAALGPAAGTALPLGELRFRRVILLLDPDADGIHAGALVQIFFYRTMRRLIEDGHVEIVHAPWGEVRDSNGEVHIAFHERGFQTMCRELEARAAGAAQRIRHRGLGTITPSVLARTCVDPRTRAARVLNLRDVEVAVRMFGGTSTD